MEVEGFPPICSDCACFVHGDALCLTKSVWQLKEKEADATKEGGEIIEGSTQADNLGLGG